MRTAEAADAYTGGHRTPARGNHIQPAFWPCLIEHTLATTHRQDDEQHGAEQFCEECGIGLNEEAAKLSARQRLVHTELRA